ncbi:MAG: hypothetical protein JEZ06_01715 [Anaerolineaceae bacterium]|nr:hypothetical protein [Anaerolineaceae bacterium]
MSNRILNEAITLFKSGERGEANSLLTQLVIQDSSNELAWMWLAACKNTDEEKRVCLQRALEANPDNAKARQALDNLKPEEPPESELNSPIDQQETRKIDDFQEDLAPTIAIRRKDLKLEQEEVSPDQIKDVIVPVESYDEEYVESDTNTGTTSNNFFQNVLISLRKNLASYILILLLIIGQIWTLIRTNELETALAETRTQLNETMMELLVIEGILENRE